MTPIALGVVAGLAFLQASISAPRDGFADCLKRASVEAVTQKVSAAQYSAFAAQQCSAQGTRFKSALVAFDVKNGVKRGQAATDAQLQLDDYIAMSAEKYVSKAPQAAPASQAAQAPAPAPIQAAAPAKQDN